MLYLQQQHLNFRVKIVEIMIISILPFLPSNPSFQIHTLIFSNVVTCTHTCISKFNLLVSLMVWIYVLWDDHLILDYQLVCFSLAKTTSPIFSIPQLLLSVYMFEDSWDFPIHFSMTIAIVLIWCIVQDCLLVPSRLDMTNQTETALIETLLDLLSQASY